MSNAKANVLFFHQSADLYGSDRVLVWLLENMQRSALHPIVLVPCDGPLRPVLKSMGVETHVVPLVKITRSMLSGPGMLNLPVQLFRSLTAIRQKLAGRKVGLVYSNTLAMLSGAIFSLFSRRPHVWHVHEIVIAPRLIALAFPRLVSLFADRVICNSRPTQQWLLSVKPALQTKCEVIWNGIPDAPLDAAAAGRQWRVALGIKDDELVVTLVGRINRLKGQRLFVEAAEKLAAHGVRLRFVIVGSAPSGQEFFLDELRQRVAQSPIRERIVFCDFTSNVWPVWHGTDIAVVPSTEPESFGLVAVEAMAAGKPVVASRLGGVLDIVVDGETGLLFESGNADDFAAKLALLAEASELRARMGEAARKRQRQLFSASAFSESVQRLLEEVRDGVSNS